MTKETDEAAHKIDHEYAVIASKLGQHVIKHFLFDPVILEYMQRLHKLAEAKQQLNQLEKP